MTLERSDPVDGSGRDAPAVDDRAPGPSHDVGLVAVHERLREAILTGQIPAGRTMSQVQLATQLGVSRTPLREALRLLQSEGLVQSERNRMVRVSPLSVPDLEGIYALRIVTEGFAARVTVPSLSDADLTRLDELLGEMQELAGRRDETWEIPHREFHRLLVQNAGARPGKLISELTDHSQRYRQMYLAHGPRAWTVGAAEHEEIVVACRAGDALLAADRLARHLSRTALTVMMIISPEHEPALVRAAVRAVVGSEEPRSR